MVYKNWWFWVIGVLIVLIVVFSLVSYNSSSGFLFKDIDVFKGIDGLLGEVIRIIDVGKSAGGRENEYFGVVRAAVSDSLVEKTSVVHYFLVNDEDKSFLLEPPTESYRFEVGARLRVTGQMQDGKLYVENSEVLEASPQSPTNLPGGGNSGVLSTVGPQRVLVVLANLLDTPLDEASPFTREEVYSMVLDSGNPESVNSYFKEVSYNIMYLDGSVDDVYGWYTIPFPEEIICTFPHLFLNQLNIPGWADNSIVDFFDPYVDFNDYERMIVILPEFPCDWTETSTIGNSYFVTDEGVIGLSISLVRPFGSDTTAASTFLHATLKGLGNQFGLWSANFLECNFDSIRLDVPPRAGVISPSCGNPIGPINDDFSIYDPLYYPLYYTFDDIILGGDFFDGMGDTSTGHFGPYFKESLGWLTAEDVLYFPTTGVYQLNPIETDVEGYEAIVTHVDNILFYIFYRRPIGFDDLDFSYLHFFNSYLNDFPDLTHTDLLNYFFGGAMLQVPSGSWTICTNNDNCPGSYTCQESVLVNVCSPTFGIASDLLDMVPNFYLTLDHPLAAPDNFNVVLHEGETFSYLGSIEFGGFSESDGFKLSVLSVEEDKLTIEITNCSDSVEHVCYNPSTIGSIDACGGFLSSTVTVCSTPTPWCADDHSEHIINAVNSGECVNCPLLDVAQCIECFDGAQCESGLCYNYTCVECINYSDCSGTTICQDNQCVQVECTNDGDCPESYICQDNVCLTPCYPNDECVPTSQYGLYICRNLDTYSECVIDENGCYVWSEPQSCPDFETCHDFGNVTACTSENVEDCACICIIEDVCQTLELCGWTDVCGEQQFCASCPFGHTCTNSFDPNGECCLEVGVECNIQGTEVISTLSCPSGLHQGGTVETCDYDEEICFDGSCVTSCTETDGGVNYYVKGRTTFTNPENASDSFWADDVCYTGNLLREHYCQNGIIAFVDKTCDEFESYACIDGACVESCEFTAAAWDRTLASEGMEVSAIVWGNSVDCFNRLVRFDVYEDGLLVDDLVDSFTWSFGQDLSLRLEATWEAIRPNFGSGDPKLYFVAELVTNEGIEITSSNMLTVIEAYCGNNITEFWNGEQCDDGNTVNEDGCNSFCLIEFCGDNVCQDGEERCPIVCVDDCYYPGDPNIPVCDSFLAGTKILMGDGSKRNIENVRVGEEVLSFDVDNGKIVKGRVRGTKVHGALGYYVLNGEIKVTGTHPFFVNGEWKKVKDLVVGDKMMNYKKENVEIGLIESVHAKENVYNIFVENFNTYFVQGVLVHNKQPCITTNGAIVDEKGWITGYENERIKEQINKITGGVIYDSNPTRLVNCDEVYRPGGLE